MSTNTNSTHLSELRHLVSSLHHWLNANDQAIDVLAPIVGRAALRTFVTIWPRISSNPLFAGETETPATRRALDFIEGNLQRQLTVGEIAKASGISTRSLQTMFKREFGCTPVEYLTNLRLDHARADLANRGESNIREIAIRWGFNHMSDFSRRYRERFGHSPSATSALRLKP